MADQLSATARAMLSGDMDSVFQTMSNGRTVTIVKEPIKTLVSNPITDNNVFGFGEQQTDAVYTYTPVQATFPAMIMYGRSAPSPLNPEINVRVYAGPVTIKVKKDCAEYIKNGITKHIEADGKMFYLDGEERRQMFLNADYFIYNLKTTK